MNNLSLAIWTQKEISFEGGRKEVHFNVWNINDHHALDVGIMLPREPFEGNEASLYIYFPFECEIKDLYNCLTSDDKSLVSVFNCFFHISSCQNGVKCKSVKIDEKTQFCLTSFKNSKIEGYKDGLVFEINPIIHTGSCENDNKRDNYYIRFRVEGDCIKSSYFVSEKESSRLENFTEDISFLDFRYNDRRILPDDVAHNISEKGCLIDLDLIQFFYICHASYKIEQTKKEINNMRSLEEHLWDGYFPDLVADKQGTSILTSLKHCFLYFFGIGKPDAAIAYQRKTTPKKDEKLTDFSFLIRLSYQRFHIRKALITFIIACAFSFGISFLASMAYDKWMPSSTLDDAQRG